MAKGGERGGMGGGSNGIDSTGTGDPGEVGDGGMRDAWCICAIKPASSEFAFAPPNGNDFFPPLGLFPEAEPCTERAYRGKTGPALSATPMRVSRMGNRCGGWARAISFYLLD